VEEVWNKAGREENKVGRERSSQGGKEDWLGGKGKRWGGKGIRWGGKRNTRREGNKVGGKRCRGIREKNNAGM